MTKAELTFVQQLALSVVSHETAVRLLEAEGFTRTEIDHALLELPRNRGKVAGVDGLTTLERGASA